MVCEAEKSHLNRERIAARGSKPANPAFDVTPPDYITGFITEAGVLEVGEMSQLVGDE